MSDDTGETEETASVNNEPTELDALGEEVGAASDPLEGSSQAHSDLTIEDVMAYPPKSAREDFKVTRYPVSMAQYEELCLQARSLEPEPTAAEAEATADTADVDDGDDDGGTVLVDESELEAAEGESIAEATAELSAGPAPAAPPKTNSFEGIPATAWRPPDCTIATGPNDVLVAVNTDLAGFTRGGTLKFRWPNMTTLFKNVLPNNAKVFDPRVAYDHYAKRWIVVAAATRPNPQGAWFLLGVSQSTNPAGRYWIWALDARRNGNTVTNNWGDYPMLGFDTQGIYITANMFKFGGGFQYSKLRILKKSQVYSGGAIQWYDYWNLKNPDGSKAFTVQPCVHYRGTGGNPSAYLVNALWPEGNKLTLWTLKNPVGYWAGGSATLSKRSVNCRSYDLPPNADQKGTSTTIETNDDRLLNAIYQFTGGTRRIWTSQTGRHSWSGDSEARSVVQWYEIDVNSGSMAQQNRYGAKGLYYYYPSIQTDQGRNAFVVFGRSGANQYAQLRYTGRRVSAPPNQLEGSRLIKSGESSYTGGRWGDYFGICRDTTGRAWMYGEFADSGGAWGTWIAAAKY